MMDTKEIFGWFPVESQTVVHKLIEDHGIKTVIEIGCFLGKSTIFMAKRVDHVLGIDPFVKWEDKGRPNGDIDKYGGDDFFDKFWENVVDAGVYDKVSTFKMTSEEVLPLLKEPEDYADMVYIDGLHDYDSVKNDLRWYIRFAKKIICGDDYDENWPGVKQAVDEKFGDRVKVEGRIWYVVL